MTINAVTAKLLALLHQNTPLTGEAALPTGEATPLTGEAALLSISNEMQHPDPQMVIEGGGAILEELRANDIILGTYQQTDGHT